MTNKLFVLGVATVAFAGTTLLNVQSSKADQVITGGLTTAKVIPGVSVATSTSVSVAVGKNPIATSTSGSTAAPGFASATTSSGASTAKTSITGSSISTASAGKKTPSIASGTATVGGIGSGFVVSGSETYTQKGYAGSAAGYVGQLENVNYGYKKW
jgi:hypothetical protein